MDKREAPPIGREEVLQAAQTLREYKNGKSALERRIVANEQWWKLRHWQQMNLHDPRETVEPASAWLFNIILNKHADAMDNRPEPVVLPREEGDKQGGGDAVPGYPAGGPGAGRRLRAGVLATCGGTSSRQGTGVQRGYFGTIASDKRPGGHRDPARSTCCNLFWEPGIQRYAATAGTCSTWMLDG